MKRILIILQLLLLSCVFYTLPVFAADSTPSSSNGGAEMLSPSPTPVDYQLPYPGLLPDNFLYKLKTLRDRIIGFLISDPLKRIDFDILQADKRYNASMYLFRASPEKEDLIVSTVSKADNYMEEAIGQLELAKKQGIGIQDLTDKLLLSNQKHLEVIGTIEKTAPETLKKSLDQEKQRITHIKNTVTTQLQNK